MKNEIKDKIARKLYSLFVVNRRAIAIQLADGNYITKYTNVLENDIYSMLDYRKSIGTYQQLYRSPYIKWICFDFDCKNKDEPNLDLLYKNCIKPLNAFLKNNKIYYANEFSGRRGIHTWILFDDYITKKEGYNLIQAIKEGVQWEYDPSTFGLDLFPATSSSYGNIVGKQVKIPLSFHRNGGYSYFFENDFHSEKIGEEFFENQLSILNSIKLNSYKEISAQLNIEELFNESSFKKISLNRPIECEAKKIIKILSETNVFKSLLDRIYHGVPNQMDWLVMLGTLVKIQNGNKLLNEIFKYCPTYSEEETNNKIQILGRKYYPATFGYLYKAYDLEQEAWIDPNETGLQFLIRKLGIDIKEEELRLNEVSLTADCSITIKKEINYLFSNDEVPVVSVFDDLKHMTLYDSKRIDENYNKIKKGESLENIPSNFILFNRYETDEKSRVMVSLSAYDRVMTSHIALNIFYDLNNSFKSFSYNPNYLSNEEIFYPWYTSWANYLGQIRKYLEIDLYSDMFVLTIDIKNFYDSIDFLGIYNLLNKRLTLEQNNLLRYLINYNEKLMKLIRNNRKGVPQGPAYARIIAECFLGILIDKSLNELSEYRGDINLYRYVDDIIIFHRKSINSKKIFDTLDSIFKMYGLDINLEKSIIYGEIGKLNKTQKDSLLRSDNFQYGLRVTNYSYLKDEEYIREKTNRIITKKGGFNSSDLSFFFSKYTDDRAKEMYFSRYVSDIIKSKFGRGSGFQLFYKYLFENEEKLLFCIERNYFSEIPYNTVNFSSLLATFFYAIQERKISKDIQHLFIEKAIKKINIEEIEGKEDKSLILALSNLVI